MKIRVTFEKDVAEELTAKLKTLDIEEFQKEEEKGNQITRIYNIEPNKYRDINQVCKKVDKVIIEVLVGVIVN